MGTDDGTGATPPPSLRPRPPRWLLALVTALFALLLLGATTRRAVGRSTSSWPHTVTTFVAVPADRDVDYLLAAAARHEAEVAMAWVESEVGRTLRRGPDYAAVVVLAHPEAHYAGPPERAARMILREVRDTVADRTGTFPLVMADLRTHSPSAPVRTCGIGGRGGVVMLVDNCPSQNLSTTSTWGSDASVTIAHEILHGLGAVPECAPNGHDGHVEDDPDDIMRARGVYGADPSTITLDSGRDDYLDHGIPGCHDILDSPLWLPG